MEKKLKQVDFAEKICPSIFASDFSIIKDEIKKIEDFGCKIIHLDVMDGNFVPNISFGPKITSDILNVTNLIADLHLMVSNPSFFIDKFLFDKIKYITFHLEALNSEEDIFNLINKIKKINRKVGISIKPKTDVSKIEKYLKELDLVLVMSVEPGFSGQKLIEDSLIKIDYLDIYRKKNDLRFLIQVDGGINFENAKSIIEKGADLIVIGSAFFK
ncbi:MAG: ribulose-phosphate 3-epimerase [Spirochaetales bacterium]|jgi:ribulose-phosphate 3-epimerase|nr:ribulose-phosphate 3-epimerase [Exilispira sp.]NMC68085.1 ribulose-phosphate 3-epimerase [Spirochaetales bacterium]